ncbi:hypothetical protein HMPREF1153_0658 [Selenomonas sp. CM52]|nr:hypothetical protein HMPREF1153_0658 [Selenomonas sp. CM52]
MSTKWTFVRVVYIRPSPAIPCRLQNIFFLRYNQDVRRKKSVLYEMDVRKY